MRKRTFGLHLGCELSGFHRAIDILTDVERTTVSIRVPPVDERRIVGSLVTDFPIKLRNVIIHPAFLHPKKDVGIEIVIVLQTIRIGTVRIMFLVAVDTERTDAEAHPGFGQDNRPFHLLNQLVDIFTSPITDIIRRISGRNAIFLKTLLIGECFSGVWIGIKIVVHVNRIHIITRQDIFHHIANELTAFGK